MHNDQKQASLFERLAVVAMFLLVAAFAIQNVWRRVKASEVRTLNNAVGDYEALKKIYPEQFHTLPQSTLPMNASGAVIPLNAPMNLTAQPIDLTAE
jgi:hypothetical protein